MKLVGKDISDKNEGIFGIKKIHPKIQWYFTELN
jgi:hypothetical protein